MPPSITDLAHLREALTTIRARCSHRFTHPLQLVEPVRGFTDDWRKYAQPEYLSVISVKPQRIFFRFIHNVPHRTLLTVDVSGFDAEGMCPDKFVEADVVVETMRTLAHSHGINFFLTIHL
jgi:hypothetical protein